ncbi:MAG: rhomboid family intramembrane serine protease, partial [Paramuribaculum sp.]|nr:rhomboid family intramembrane serine protease [Paramuribaculum sp.]
MRQLLARISTPAATALIIAINAVVFVAVHIFGSWSEMLLGLFTLPLSISDIAVRPWAPLTYMFTQYAPFHLLANMLLLYFYASPAVSAAGQLSSRRLWVVYLLGGIAGALAALLACRITAYPSDGLVGASASVLAVMAYTTLRLPHIKTPLVFFGMVELRVLTLILVLLVIIATGPSAVDTQAAHAGGFLAGVAFALLLKQRTPRRVIATPTKSPQPIAIPTPAPSTIPDVPDNEMLDMLLDKIRSSGYNSLTEE